MNHFRATPENPYHISIGALVVNKEGKICCHCYPELESAAGVLLNDFYLLMRETIEPGESIEECLARGLMEEFGMVATMKSYLGSIVSHVPFRGGVTFEKTTIYFLCDFVSMNESDRKTGDHESTSQIQWLDPEDLKLKMKEQWGKLKMEDADESKIIENYLKHLK